MLRSCHALVVALVEIPLQGDDKALTLDGTRAPLTASSSARLKLASR